MHTLSRSGWQAVCATSPVRARCDCVIVRVWCSNWNHENRCRSFGSAKGCVLDANGCVFECCGTGSREGKFAKGCRLQRSPAQKQFIGNATVTHDAAGASTNSKFTAAWTRQNRFANLLIVQKKVGQNRNTALFFRFRTVVLREIGGLRTLLRGSKTGRTFFAVRATNSFEIL